MPQGPGNYNQILAGFGEQIEIQQGGRLILAKPGNTAGNMSLGDMQNRVWHLLREPGPDTGQPAPQTGDYNETVVQRDLNIALAQFISQTGLAPKISEVQKDFPVYPGLDYPLPPDLQSLVRIDYTIAGQTPFKLIPLNWEDFDRKLGDQITAATGNPYYYRQSFAGYIRLQPAPTLANFLGPGIGTVSLGGTVHVGDSTTITVQNPGFVPVTTPAYITQPSDSLATISNSLSTLLNDTAAVQGSTSFLQPSGITGPYSNAIQLTAIVAPGTGITYYAQTTSTTMTVTPAVATYLSPNGDIMTFYYTSTGDVMLTTLDGPGIPPQFHMTLVYGVLKDYWLRKQDLNMAKEYDRRYKEDVLAAKKLEWDSERETQPTIAGADDSELFGTPGIPY